MLDSATDEQGILLVASSARKSIRGLNMWGIGCGNIVIFEPVSQIMHCPSGTFCGTREMRSIATPASVLSIRIASAPQLWRTSHLSLSREEGNRHFRSFGDFLLMGEAYLVGYIEQADDLRPD
jgi:hypothetical protein